MSLHEFEHLLRERPELFIATRFQGRQSIEADDFKTLKLYGAPMLAVSVEEYVAVITAGTLAGKWELDF